MVRQLMLAAGFIAKQLVAQPFVLDGPDAPVVALSWDNGYVITLSDPPGSNNAGQIYQEYDAALADTPDPIWDFQGYLVFQVRPDFNPYSDNCFDPDQSRLVAASDIADGITVLSGVRHVHLDSSGVTLVDTCYLESIIGADAGIQDTYIIPLDAFTSAPFGPLDTVCFLALAYATNAYGVDTVCGVADGVLIGMHAAAGALGTTCVTALTAAVRSTVRPLETQLWPVPADQVLNWSCEAIPQEIRLLDALGQVVSSTKPGARSGELMVDAIPTGAYVLSFSFNDGRSAVRAVQIAHP